MMCVQVAERPQRRQPELTKAARWFKRSGAPAADSYWLATTAPEGRPRVLPVLEVWLDGALYVSAGQFSGGSTFPPDAHRAVISIGRHALDPMIEGDATPVTDETTLRRVAAEYAYRYGWPLPQRGGQPFEVYEVTPTTVVDLGEDSPFSASRWSC